MSKSKIFRAVLASTASAAALLGSAQAHQFNIPSGDLEAALNAYSAQTGVQVLIAGDVVNGVRSKGAAGDLSTDAALSQILSGTGFSAHRTPSGAIGIVRDHSSLNEVAPLQLAQASPPQRAVETVTVTSSKLGGADVQSIPIAVTALSQEQLTSSQTAGGPDLIKQVPNLTFTKTNFTGYSIQIRGIGTQAISVATDPAVAVALNDIPFIRNHFFEQEFFDLGQAEVLRGPQGTLYGRNATAGVVNLITAKPTDQFEASASADIGNYKNRRFEAMVNLPIVDDRLDLRVAGEWTKRAGYTTNASSGNQVDGRDLWSSRLTLGWKPIEQLQAYLVWEHFSENDDRMRSSKQLCKTDPVPAEVGGEPIPPGGGSAEAIGYGALHFLTQGCRMGSLYSDDAFGVPNGESLPYFIPLAAKIGGGGLIGGDFDIYASTTQSHNLRVIETQLDPVYKAKNDTVELNVDYSVTPTLTVTSQTGYNQDFLWSTEDYNRFNTRPGAFSATSKLPNLVTPDPSGLGICTTSTGCGGGVAAGQPCTPVPGIGGCTAYGVFCDPQLGCSNSLVAQDLNEEHAWQLSQEVRFASKFNGPFNFSVGGNYLHYETEENYYVFINTLTLAAYSWGAGTSGAPIQTLPWVPGVSDNANCLKDGIGALVDLNVPNKIGPGASNECMYIDPNPLTSLNKQGHSYFLSQNPYTLNSYAGFGEAYYNITNELKLIGGLRWTDDRKHFTDIPSELLVRGYGYPVSGIVDQEWQKFTGRAVVNWTPKLNFTDQTLVYGSYSRGYKAGGANPPGAVLLTFADNEIPNPIHPLTFKPEYINAYELGTKNSLFDGGLTLNGDIFFYDYKGYQISRIVDRTAINDNFDATVKGAELEASYEPTPGLKFHFAGGYEETGIANGQSSVDLIDRTDATNHPDWVVVKPFPTQASNCILPAYVIAAILQARGAFTAPGSGGVSGACANAYTSQFDPPTGLPYVPNPTEMVNYAIGGTLPLGVPGYPGFNPLTAPNGGQGFAKDLSGNELPNAPPFTASFSAEYSTPITADWAATLHGDYYWQDYSWARVFNDKPYDRLRGYTTVNLALILTNQNGWQVMSYLKNVFNTTAITGDFLNSDDSGLTTNVFLTDPRLFGVRVTKNW